MKLKPNEIRELTEFVLDHFDFFSLNALLLQRTDVVLGHQIPFGANFEDAIPQFIHTQSKNNKINPILLAVDSKFPNEPFLKKIILDQGVGYQMYNASPENSVLSTDALQGMVNSEPWFEATKFFNGIGRVKRCVCKVVTTAGSGTGFLISPNQVMTNYHVVQNVLENNALLNQTQVIFDYEAQEDNTIFQGQTFSVNQTKPIELFSEYCIHDFNGEANLKLECIDPKLDYAILNLEDEIGNLSLEGNVLTNTSKAKGEAKRGWISLKVPDDNQLFEKGSVIIFQHPEGNPQKIALGLNRIMAVSPTEKRVRYNVNTMHGSSGSPVFNTNFELIALHNMGDPSFRPEFNQGVVIERIINDLVEKGYQIQL